MSQNNMTIFNVLGGSPFILHSTNIYHSCNKYLLSSNYVLSVVLGAMWMLLPLYITICVH